MANSQSFTLSIKALFDASDVRAKVGEIQKAFSNIKLPDNLKGNLDKAFSGVEKAIADFETKAQKGVSTKADAKGISTSIDGILREFDKLQSAATQIQGLIREGADLSQFFKLDESAAEKIKGLQQEIETIQSKIDGIKTDKLSELQKIVNGFRKGSGTAKGATEALELFKEGNIEGAIALLTKLETKLTSVKKGLATRGQDTTSIEATIAQVGVMKAQMGEAQTKISESMGEISSKTAEVASITNSTFQGMAQGIDQAANNAKDLNSELHNTAPSLKDATTNSAQLNTELGQIKSRIQYFVGLTNAVNLFKRAVTSAFNTVKELDAAMTETAVVTDKTVSDMWKQLPEYTSRANSLGVTTLDAYKAATLYYQQGLNDQQAAELSNETLKMARIAGLDAAEATDRMTNALRGFNMELNAMNAQRIDDVYSQLAAMSASNVDEISTAMTKVASLANNANMDFETTSAFLAQIIETTRESAETAGTALKTVVARFSEVKKLYSEGELKGTSEEGEAIDVNRISTALRTAGIDLNKYFLGEVGLDDIFMELASKWDSLTSVQQRYIATQAAGSRQQSRFIAMMQDYARTQELVGAAYSANGAAAEQFEKTQSSLQSKLARLKNAWDEFAMGLANNALIKLAVDALTLLLNAVNKLTGAFGPAIGGILKFTTAALTLIGLRNAFKSGGIVMKGLDKFSNTKVGQFILGTKGQDEAGASAKLAQGGESAKTSMKVGGEAAAKALVKGATEAANIEKGGAVEETATENAGVAQKVATENIGAMNEVTTEIAGATNEEAVEIEGAVQETTIEKGNINIGNADLGKGNVDFFKGFGSPEATLRSGTDRNLLTQGANLITNAPKIDNGAAAISNAIPEIESLGKVASNSADDILDFTNAASGSGKIIANSADDAVNNLSKLTAVAPTASSAAGAAGLSGLAIAGIVAAVIAAVVGSIALQDYFTSGKREQKLAEEAAKTQKKAAESQKETAKLQRDSYEKYLENEKIYRTSTNASERSAAQTQMRLALAELKGINSQNVTINVAGEEVLDRNFAEIYAQQLEEEANITEAGVHFADGATSFAEAVRQDNLKRAKEGGNKGGSIWQEFKWSFDTGWDYNFDNDKYNSEQDAKIDAAMARARDEIRVGAYDLIKNQYDSETAGLIAQAYAENFDFEAYNQQVEELTKVKQLTDLEEKTMMLSGGGWLVRSLSLAFKRGDLVSQYEATHGAGSAKELTTEELSQVLAQEEALEKQAERLVKYGTFAATQTGKDFLAAYTGGGKLAEINLTNPNVNLDDEDAFGTFLEDTLGITKDTIEAYADATGEDVKVIEQNLRTQAKQAQYQQKIQKVDLYSKFLQGGISTEGLVDWIESLAPEMMGVVSNIATQAMDTMSRGGVDTLLQSMQSMSKEDFSEISDFFSGFNLDDPINAFKALKDAEAQAKENSPFKAMLDDIKVANAALFDYGNLVQNFIASSTYQNLNSSIEDFIKANGEITAKNIEELAESCEELQTLLDEDTISAQGLAKAFSLYESGTISFDGITTSFLSAVSAGETFLSLTEEVQEWIDNFNEGTDMAQGTEHIISTLDKAGEYIEDWQFGNEPLEKAYDHIFGEGKYKEYMDENWGNLSYDEIEENLTGRLDQIKAWAENEGVGGLDYLIANPDKAGKLNVSYDEQLGYQLDLSQYQSAAEVISDVATAFGISEDAARSFIEAWSSHMWDFGKSWDQLNFDDQLKAFSLSLDGQLVVTEQELKAFAEATGKNLEEIIAAFEEKGITLPTRVNWQGENGAPLSGDELISSFYSMVGAGYKSTSMDSTGTRPMAGGVLSPSVKVFEQGQLAQFVSQKEIDGETKSVVDYDALQTELVGAYKFTSQQAQEISETFAKNAGASLSRDVQKTVLDEKTGEYTTTIETITADSIEALDAATAAAQQKNQLELQAQMLTDGLDWSGVTSGLQAAIEAAGKNANIQIKASVVPTKGTPSSSGGQGTATGGVVGSYAKGSENFHVSPGVALTGEEGPEIVWNKKGGYAYITGGNGPEFQNLKPGDRVFNANETKHILYRSKANDNSVTPGMVLGAIGAWKKTIKTPSGPDNTSPTKKKPEWENTLDWLYNLMEDISELERVQTRLSETHDRYLEDISKTGRDLYNVTKQQLDNLLTQRDNYQEALNRRLQEMREQITEADEELRKYVWWNAEDQTIEIDWDAINEIDNEDTFKEVTDLVSKAEKIQDQIDEAEEAIWNIDGEIKEIESRYLQEFIDFQKRVYDAVVYQYQQQIDELTSLNETLNDSNEKILSSIQREIELQRQIRDNTDKENEISEKEARLAYLRRDTTGANAEEIRSLEKEIEDARKSYTDELIDQAIDRLEQQNSDAAEQRQHQIDLMTSQLDYWKEVGAFWPEVARLLDEGINGDGSLIRGSTLEEILKGAEGWKAMSEQEREVWANDLINEAHTAGAYILKMSEGLDSLSKGIWALIPESSIPAWAREDGFATGGLTTKTGPAWVDGTPASPEYILNAQQTEAFLELTDTLPSLLSGTNGTTNNYGGNVYVEVNLNVGEISNDYDVDSLVDRIKTDIYDAAAYRNVNTIGRSR